MRARTRAAIAYAGATVLASCVTSGAGSGSITLGQGATEAFRAYQAKSGPMWFVVSQDGRVSHYDYCSEGMSKCIPGPSYNLIEACESRSRMKCYILAQDGRIVWDGPVTLFGAHAAAPTRFKSPAVGLRIEFEKGHIQVASVSGSTITTTDGSDRTTRWLGGIFQFDAARIVSPNDLSEGWRAGPGKDLNFTERRGSDVWRHVILYIGPDKLTVDGRTYAVEKYLRRPGLLPENPRRMLYFSETLWYAPEIGFLLRRDVMSAEGTPSVPVPFAATRIVEP